ncbi:hypothetical protein GF373_08535 [bacterium]|nr:hypothetical protein [bacterium]
MPGNRYSDESKNDRTPYNIKADYTDVDHGFRMKLDRMVPSNLSDRINQVLLRRVQKEEDEAV